MPVTVVVGGQFGGEGKGKVAHFLAQETGSRIAIRVGGTNSGHTVIDLSGQPLILRQLPTPSILPGVTCVLGAGSYINLDILFDEIKRTGLSHDHLYIDPNAMIITEGDQQEEANSELRTSIGSTLSGTGAAVIRRIRRASGTRLAKDDERLKRYIKPVAEFLRDSLADRERIIIEGTQGFGLSLLHSPYYPYVTSRDTTAAAFVCEASLSPLDVDDIVLVIRAFPIRVAGKSGPLPNEIDWNTVKSWSNSSDQIHESSSVTKTTRRVASFDDAIVRSAIKVNRPTRIVLNHLDYVDGRATDSTVTDKCFRFVADLEDKLGRRINYLGTSKRSCIENRISFLSISKAVHPTR